MTLMFKNWAEVEAVFAEAFDVPPSALAAATGTAKTAEQAECEASQSGGSESERNAQPLSNQSVTRKE